MPPAPARLQAASRSSPLFFPFPWGAACGSGAQPLAMGSPPNREGLWPRRPSPLRPVPASVGFLSCAFLLPPPSGFPRQDPRLWRSYLLES